MSITTALRRSGDHSSATKDKVLQRFLDGPQGQAIRDEIELEEYQSRAAIRGDLDALEREQATSITRLEASRDEAAAEVAAIKAQLIAPQRRLDGAEQELKQARYRFTRSRDRLLRDLRRSEPASVAHLRVELRALIEEIQASMSSHLPTDEFRQLKARFDRLRRLIERDLDELATTALPPEELARRIGAIREMAGLE